MKKMVVINLVLLTLLSCSQGIELNRVKGIHGPNAPKVTEQGVVFSILAPDAVLVTIAGNFNGWNHIATPLTKGNDGVWKITIPLPKNQKYLYQFVVDGYWIADPDNPKVENSGEGPVYSVIEVR